jgi:hypothetical protein
MDVKLDASLPTASVQLAIPLWPAAVPQYPRATPTSLMPTTTRPMDVNLHVRPPTVFVAIMQVDANDFLPNIKSN